MKPRILFSYKKLLFLLLFLGVNNVFATPITLKVGVYPYVPRIAQFKNVIQAQWEKAQPNVKLIFVEIAQWDGGYSTTPSDDLDVFVFDSIYFNSFLSKGFLAPIAENEIKNLDDFFEYAIEGVQHKGKYYGIPQLGCSNILFYKKNDIKMAQVKSIQDMKDTLGTCTYKGVKPSSDIGLMLNLKGKTTNASYYLAMNYEKEGLYPLSTQDTKNLNTDIINDMRSLLEMASYTNANTANKALAIQLANIMASAETMVKSIQPETVEGVEMPAQYLMATRPSVFNKLGKSLPLYENMHTMIKNSQPIMFKLSDDSESWLSELGQSVHDKVYHNYSCKNEISTNTQ